MKRSLFFGILVMVCFQSGFCSEKLSYAGSSTIGEGIMQAGAIEAFKKKTDIEFEFIKNCGSGKGVIELVGGRCKIAGISRALNANELMNYHPVVIGYDAIGVFVNVDNPVTDLSIKQLQGIFSGLIKNWKEVGGKDAIITPSTEILNSGRATLEAFSNLVMKDTPYSNNLKAIDLPKNQLIYLSKDKTGICTVGVGLYNVCPKNVKNTVKLIKVNGIAATYENVRSSKYPILRPLILITNDYENNKVKAFYDFILSKEGQDIVGINFVGVK